MIDFETLGDLLRKNKIPQRTLMKDSPVIAIAANDGHSIYFVFDRSGRLVDIVVMH